MGLNILEINQNPKPQASAGDTLERILLFLAEHILLLHDILHDNLPYPSKTALKHLQCQMLPDQNCPRWSYKLRLVMRRLYGTESLWVSSMRTRSPPYPFVVVNQCRPQREGLLRILTHGSAGIDIQKKIVVSSYICMRGGEEL